MVYVVKLIKEHKFFAGPTGVNWDALMAKDDAALGERGPPIIPEVKGQQDTSNFDPYPESTELPPTSTTTTITTPKPKASSAMAFQAPNVFYQRAEDDSMVSKLGGGANVISGIDASQVPPLCKKWVLF